MENSEKLLSTAMEALREANVPDSEWDIGGGTVLAYYLSHRYSKDIDIFIADIQYMSALSPRFNNYTETALDYDEETNFISLTYEEGKIDFIVSGQLTQYAPKKEIFFNHRVFLENPVEIIVKKMFYRGGDVLPRDIFDMACVYQSSWRENLLHALRRYSEKWDVFKENFMNQRIQLIDYSYGKVFPQNIYEGGKCINGHEVAIIEDLIQKV